MSPDAPQSLWQSLKVYTEKRILLLLFLGFSSGLPLLLVLSTLSLWLAEEGISKKSIGLFALVTIPYNFKFVWAPALDALRIPWLTARLGRRRSWALVTQAGLFGALYLLGASSPADNIILTATAALLVSFCSASQDIVVDALRVELLEDDEQGAGAGTYVTGYRLGMLVAGAGALYLATYVSWASVYALMGVLMGIGAIAILLSPEPEVPIENTGEDPSSDAPVSISWGYTPFVMLGFVALFLVLTLFWDPSWRGYVLYALLAYFFTETASRARISLAVTSALFLVAGLVGDPSWLSVLPYVVVAFLVTQISEPRLTLAILILTLAIGLGVVPEMLSLGVFAAVGWLAPYFMRPFAVFTQHSGWLAILAFVAIFKIGDAMIGPMAMPFYYELDFSKAEIASITKVFGLVATLVGGLVGGLLVKRIGILRALFVCGVLQMVSNLMFVIQAEVGYSLSMLTATIGVENFASGMGATAFVAYLSALCDTRFTATQYALLSSLAAVGRIVSAQSGAIVESTGWSTFFILTTVAAIPGLILLGVLFLTFHKDWFQAEKRSHLSE